MNKWKAAKFSSQNVITSYSIHYTKLYEDSEGSLVLTVQANGDCVTVVIEAGDYSLSIHHDGSNEDSLPIFLIPSQEELEQARGIEDLVIRPTIMEPGQIQQYLLDRITSYNVCYTKLLRVKDFQWLEELGI